MNSALMFVCKKHDSDKTNRLRFTYGRTFLHVCTLVSIPTEMEYSLCFISTCAIPSCVVIRISILRVFIFVIFFSTGSSECKHATTTTGMFARRSFCFVLPMSQSHFSVSVYAYFCFLLRVPSTSTNAIQCLGHEMDS
jgi:hypothetical protein